MGISPAELIAAAREMMARTHEDIQAGKPVNLTSFEAQVRELCDSLTALPRAESAVFRSDLEQLVNELGQLSEALIHRRDAIKNELQGMSRKAQAHQAYTKAAGMKKKSGDADA